MISVWVLASMDVAARDRNLALPYQARWLQGIEEGADIFWEGRGDSVQAVCGFCLLCQRSVQSISL